MPLPRIRVYLDATGPKVVSIDGEDVTARVAEVGLKARPGAPPELWLLHHGELDLEGEGIVKLVSEAASDATEGIVAFLEAIDPEQLEADTLEGCGFGDGNLTALMLEKLKEYARGGS